MDKFRKLAERLVEERDGALAKAKRCIQISERVLKRNRSLESSLNESKATPNTSRIDASRSNGQRKTTQRTLKESVEPAPVKREAPVGTMNPPRSPAEVAAAMDEVV